MWRSGQLAGIRNMLLPFSPFEKGPFGLPPQRDPHMPKHVPTFKHLLASAQPLRESEYRERSVNELIASSRAQKPVQRDLPPHIVGSERVWAPSSGPSGLPDVEDGGVHP